MMRPELVNQSEKAARAERHPQPGVSRSRVPVPERHRRVRNDCNFVVGHALLLALDSQPGSDIAGASGAPPATDAASTPRDEHRPQRRVFLGVDLGVPPGPGPLTGPDPDMDGPLLRA